MRLSTPCDLEVRQAALVEQLPMTLGALTLISLVVCAGTAPQVATGVGLGLLAGPVLILSLQSETATGRSTVAALVPALAVGVALGVVVKRNVREATLHVALRLLLLAMGLSLLWKGFSDVAA